MAPTEDLPARTAVSRPEADVVFQVENLEVSKGQRVILSGLDLEIRRGESVVVIGDNGVGKTTLLEELFTRSD